MPLKKLLSQQDNKLFEEHSQELQRALILLHISTKDTITQKGALRIQQPNVISHFNLGKYTASKNRKM